MPILDSLFPIQHDRRDAKTGPLPGLISLISLDRSCLQSSSAITEDPCERLERIEQMAAYCRHEVRTSLAVVRSSLALLQRQVGACEASTRYIARGERNLDLIEDILEGISTTMSPQATACTEPAKPIRTDVLVAERVGDYRGLVYPRQYIREERSGGPLWVRVHPHHMFQMLDNLVANAVDHGDPDRPITIRALRKAGYVVIEVANLGSRLPVGLLDTLATPASLGACRVGTDRHNSKGLALVKVIATRYGGRLEAANLADADGVVFRVRIPAIESEDAGHSSTHR